MNDQMKTFSFLKNVNVNVFLLNTLECERVHFLRIKLQCEQIQCLSQRSKHRFYLFKMFKYLNTNIYI